MNGVRKVDDEIQNVVNGVRKVVNEIQNVVNEVRKVVNEALKVVNETPKVVNGVSAMTRFDSSGQSNHTVLPLQVLMRAIALPVLGIGTDVGAAIVQLLVGAEMPYLNSPGDTSRGF